jgi:hypothetical protein
MDNDHIIHKYIVKCSSSSGVAKEELYAQMEHVNKELLHSINTAFSQYAPADQWVDIDSITIDVGVLSVAQIKTEYKKRVTEQLLNQLEKKVPEYFSEYTATKKSSGNDVLKDFQTYLTEGYVPSKDGSIAFDLDGMFATLLTHQPAELATRLHEISHLPHVIHRLGQLSNPNLIRIREMHADLFFRISKQQSGKPDSNRFEEMIRLLFSESNTVDFNIPGSFIDNQFVLGEIIKRKTNKELTQLLFDKLSDAAFLRRISESLIVDLFIDQLKAIKTLQPSLNEWSVIKNIFYEWGFTIHFSTAFNMLALSYIRIPFSDTASKVHLLYTFLEKNMYIRDVQNSIHFFLNDAYISQAIPVIKEVLVLFKKKLAGTVNPLNDVAVLTDDTDLVMHYLRHGIIRNSDIDIVERIKKAATFSASTLAKAIRSFWNEEALRRRIAFKLPVAILQTLVEIVWETHYSYTWWLTLRDRIFLQVNIMQPVSERDVQHFHAAYFEWLARYQSTLQKQDDFEEWLLIYDRVTYDRSALRNTVSDSKEQHQYELLDRIRLKKWEQLLELPQSHKTELEQASDELHALTANPRSADMYVYVESLLQQPDACLALFYKADLSIDTWTTVFEYIKGDQLDRFVSVVLSSGHSYVSALIDEVKGVFNYSGNSIDRNLLRESLLLILFTLQRNTHTSSDILARTFVLPLLNQDVIHKQFVLFFSERRNQEIFPLLMNTLTELQPDECIRQGYISSDRFRNALQQSFPGLSGFISTYISILESAVSAPGSIQVSQIDYNALYIFFKKQNKNISAFDLVDSINTFIESVNTLAHGTIATHMLNTMHLMPQNNQYQKHYSELKEIFIQQNKSYKAIHSEAEKNNEYAGKHLEVLDKTETYVEALVRVLLGYIQKGTVSLDNIYSFTSVEAIIQDLKIISNSEMRYVSDLLRPFLKNTNNIDLLIQRKDEELEAILLKLISENRNTEFLYWEKELADLIQFADSAVSTVRVRMILRNSLFQAIGFNDPKTLSIFSYVQNVLTRLEETGIVRATAFNVLLLDQYRKKYSGNSDFIIRVFEQIFNFNAHVSAEKASEDADFENHAFYHKTFIDNTFNELYHFVHTRAVDELFLYFEFHLEKGRAFKEFLLKGNLSRQFWMDLIPLLSDTIVERMFYVLAPVNHYAIVHVAAELKEISSTYNLSSAFGQIRIGFYSAVLDELHHAGYQERTIAFEQIVLDYMEHEDRYALLNILNELFMHKPVMLMQEYPFLYKAYTVRILNDTHKSSDTVAPINNLVEYPEAVLSVNLETDGFITEKNPSDYILFIEQTFPSFGGFIHTLLITLNESGIIQSDSMRKELHAFVYNYSKEYQHAFSAAHFVETVLQFVSDKASTNKNAIVESFIRISDNKVERGESRFYPLLEILASVSETTSESSSLIDAADIEFSANEKGDRILETDVLISEKRTSDYVLFIEHTFPSFGGFIHTLLITLNESGIIQSDSMRKELYAFVYNYSKEHQHTFSSVNFVENVLHFVTDKTSLNKKAIVDSFIRISDNKIERGESRFYPLLEILTSVSEGTSGNSSLIDAADIEFSANEKSDRILETDVLISEKGTSDYVLFIEQIFPSFGGFIHTLLITLNESGIIQSDSMRKELHAFVYSYSKEHQHAFSAAQFIETVLQFVAGKTSGNKKAIAESFIRISDNKVDRGESRFYPLLEILASVSEGTSGSSSLIDAEAADLNIPVNETEDRFLYTDILISAKSTSDYILFIEQAFPSFGGFVHTLLITLNESGIIQSDSMRKELHAFIYNYSKVRQHTFSSVNFVENVLHFVADKASLNKNAIIDSFIRISDNKVERGESRFYPLLEILTSVSEGTSGNSSLIDAEAADLNLPVNETKDRILETDTLISEKSISDYILFIEQTFPSFGGFIHTLLITLNESGIIQSDSMRKELHAFVYNYSKVHQHTFSAAQFVEEVVAFVSGGISASKTSIIESFIHISKKNIARGESRFYPLNKIVTSISAIDSKNTFVRNDSEENNSILPIDAQSMYERENHRRRSVTFDAFKHAFSYYIQTGNVPAMEDMQFQSAGTFKMYVQNFFRQHSGEVVPVLKGIFSNTETFNAFLLQRDKDMYTYVLQELSGSRYAEFMRWEEEVIQFVCSVIPGIDRELVKINVSNTLTRLLIKKDRISIGLFTFLDQVFAQLKIISVDFNMDNFRAMVLSYKKQHAGSDLFIKALERMDILFLQEKRERMLHEMIQTTINKKVVKDTIEGRLLIHNSGLVIVAPFLTHYFDRLDMLTDNQFNNTTTACRAVQLLQYLATGKTECEEHELVLNKIICGVPISTFVENTLEITENEREVSASLLDGILSNWDKMNGSSVEALQENFLMRDGYLEQTDMGWKLEVNRQTLDILIDYLPWAFSMIKLPWMETNLATTWTKSNPF